MPRYGYFPDSEFPHVTVSTTFDRKQFGELELVGTFMQYKALKKAFFESIGFGGSITAAPVIWNGLVLFGACDRNFYCLDMDGKEGWRFRTEGMVLHNASAQDGKVFFGSTDRNLYALDAGTGRQMWRFATSGPIIGPILVREGVVFTGSYDGNIYAVSADSGKELWRIATAGPQEGAFERDGILYFGFGGGVFYAYDVGTRRQLWTFRTQEDATAWRGCFFGNDVIIGSFEGNLYSLDRMTGRLTWKFPAGDCVYSPTLAKGMVFFGSRDFNAYCLDAETGRLAWKFRTGGLVGQVTEYDGKAYFGSWDNIFYCTDSATGRELWRFKANGFITYFSITGGKIYFGSWDCNLYCLDAETGKLIWKFKTSLGTPSQIEPPETGIVRSAEVVWSAPEEEAKKAQQAEGQLSDYGAVSNEYASSIGGDYLGKKKRGYV